MENMERWNVLMLIIVKIEKFSFVFFIYGFWGFCNIIKNHAQLQNPKVWV